MTGLDRRLLRDILERALGDPDAEVTRLESRYFGTSVLIARANGRTCLVRVLDVGRLRQRRDQEISAAVAAGERGVGPRVWFTDDNGRWLVTDYLEGPSLAVGADPPRDLPRVLGLLRRMHDTPLERIPPALTLADRLGRRLSEINVPDGVGDRLRRLLDVRPGPPTAFCHNEPLLSNFMRDGDRLALVGLAEAGRGDPYTDLAMVANEFATESPDQDAEILSSWIGREATDDERVQLQRMRALALGLAACLAFPHGRGERWDDPSFPTFSTLMTEKRAGRFVLDTPERSWTFASVCLQTAVRLL